MNVFSCGQLEIVVDILETSASWPVPAMGTFGGGGLLGRVRDALKSFESCGIALGTVRLVMNPRVAFELVRLKSLVYSDPPSKQDWMFQWKIIPMLGSVIPFRTFPNIPGWVQDDEGKWSESPIYLVGMRTTSA